MSDCCKYHSPTVSQSRQEKSQTVESAHWIVWGPVDWSLAQPSDFYDSFFKYLKWDVDDGSHCRSSGETVGLPIYSTSSVFTFCCLEYEVLASKTVCPLRLWTRGMLGIGFSLFVSFSVSPSELFDQHTDISKESSRDGTEWTQDLLYTTQWMDGLCVLKHTPSH